MDKDFNNNDIPRDGVGFRPLHPVPLLPPGVGALDLSTRQLAPATSNDMPQLKRSAPLTKHMVNKARKQQSSNNHGPTERPSTPHPEYPVENVEFPCTKPANALQKFYVATLTTPYQLMAETATELASLNPDVAIGWRIKQNEKASDVICPSPATTVGLTKYIDQLPRMHVLQNLNKPCELMIDGANSQFGEGGYLELIEYETMQKGRLRNDLVGTSTLKMVKYYRFQTLLFRRSNMDTSLGPNKLLLHLNLNSKKSVMVLKDGHLISVEGDRPIIQSSTHFISSEAGREYESPPFHELNGQRLIVTTATECAGGVKRSTAIKIEQLPQYSFELMTCELLRQIFEYASVYKSAWSTQPPGKLASFQATYTIAHGDANLTVPTACMIRQSMVTPEMMNTCFDSTAAVPFVQMMEAARQCPTERAVLLIRRSNWRPAEHATVICGMLIDDIACPTVDKAKLWARFLVNVPPFIILGIKEELKETLVDCGLPADFVPHTGLRHGTTPTASATVFAIVSEIEGDRRQGRPSTVCTDRQVAELDGNRDCFKKLAEAASGIKHPAAGNRPNEGTKKRVISDARAANRIACANDCRRDEQHDRPPPHEQLIDDTRPKNDTSIINLMVRVTCTDEPDQDKKLLFEAIIKNGRGTHLELKGEIRVRIMCGQVDCFACMLPTAQQAHADDLSVIISPIAAGKFLDRAGVCINLLLPARVTFVDDRQWGKESLSAQMLAGTKLEETTNIDRLIVLCGGGERHTLYSDLTALRPMEQHPLYGMAVAAADDAAREGIVKMCSPAYFREGIEIETINTKDETHMHKTVFAMAEAQSRLPSDPKRPKTQLLIIGKSVSSVLKIYDGESGDWREKVLGTGNFVKSHNKHVSLTQYEDYGVEELRGRRDLPTTNRWIRYMKEGYRSGTHTAENTRLHVMSHEEMDVDKVEMDTILANKVAVRYMTIARVAEIFRSDPMRMHFDVQCVVLVGLADEPVSDIIARLALEMNIKKMISVSYSKALVPTRYPNVARDLLDQCRSPLANLHALRKARDDELLDG